MQAKSIKANSTAVIKTALQQCITRGYKPTLAIVFLTRVRVEDIDTITAVLDAESIAIFGASTSEKFKEDRIEPDGIIAHYGHRY